MSLDHDGSSDVDSVFELLDPSVQEAPTEVEDSSGDLTSTEDDEIDDEVVVDMDVASGTSGDPRFVRLHRTWWNGTSGVIDLRPLGPGETATAGSVFKYCTYTIGRIVGSAGGPGRSEFKIGLARDPFHRWDMYRESDPKPFTHMFLLHTTETREGANYLEVGLINHCWCVHGCVNRARRDRGGAGGLRNDDAGPCVAYVVANRLAP